MDQSGCYKMHYILSGLLCSWTIYILWMTSVLALPQMVIKKWTMLSSVAVRCPVVAAALRAMAVLIGDYSIHSLPPTGGYLWPARAVKKSLPIWSNKLTDNFHSMCWYWSFTSRQHLRSYRDEYPPVTVCFHGSFIVLPSWETRLQAPWPDNIRLSHIILSLIQPVPFPF